MSELLFGLFVLGMALVVYSFSLLYHESYGSFILTLTLGISALWLVWVGSQNTRFYMPKTVSYKRPRRRRAVRR
jgi:hypothetical protein